MTNQPVAPFRANHVGSLLRPPELLEAREKHQKAEIDAAQLRQVEDRCIRDAVKLDWNCAKYARVEADRLGDVGVAAPVGGALGKPELVQVAGAARRVPGGARLHLRGILDQVAAPAEPPRMNHVSRPVSGGLENFPLSQT